MNKDKVYEIMIHEYRETCRDYYETFFGEELNVQYIMKNRTTLEEISGEVSGRRVDETSKEIMKTIKRMMIQIFGEDIKDELNAIRKEERLKEKTFFEKNPQYIFHVTDIR